VVSLYMFYLGGNAGRSNIEVHDVQFVAVSQVEDAYPLLREAWFGDKDKLHLDGYMQVKWADGYDVTLSNEKPAGQLKLFFVNVGGYRPGQLAEVHDFGLFVAASADEAKEKAKQQLLAGFDKQHKDNLKDVDDCLLLEQLNGYHIVLQENPAGQPGQADWQGYRPIGTEAGS